jgi:hypothetical protein
VRKLAEEESIFLKSEYPFTAILQFLEKIDIFRESFSFAAIVDLAG